MADIADRINGPSARQELPRQKAQEHGPALPGAVVKASGGARARRRLEFSIFFFSADGTAVEEDRYRLLTESARFADRHGFSAVWTPERHFQVFGGLYPNPGVLSAALAMVTERVQIRAGSLVLPLQNAVRVAEDWAVVDNLSHGRAGISFATGWHHHDYVIAPGNFEDRREIMFRDIEVVRRLWAGEEVLLPAPDGKMMQVNTLPRPIQKELPFWLTVSSPRTWQKAGEIGANVLTALAGVPLDDLRGHIAVYRKARLDNGYDPRTGIVSLMLHTYVEKDLEVIRALVREPMKNYLQSYLDQFRPMTGQGLTDASSPEMQELLELAFEHYFETSSLLGTPGKCAALLEKVAAVGVNEAACLIDFGLDFETVMKGLEHLADLRLSLARETGVAENSLEFGS